MKLEFSRLVFGKKNPQISNFMKIRPVKAELFHADGWTDTETERQSLFRNCAEGPKTNYNGLRVFKM